VGGHLCDYEIQIEQAAGDPGTQNHPGHGHKLPEGEDKNQTLANLKQQTRDKEL